MKHALLAIPVAVLLAGCTAQAPGPAPAKGKTGQEVVVPEQAKLEAAASQYARVDIGADVSALPENERKALAKMVEAGWVMDGLFLRQVWGGNEGMLLNLLTDRSALGQARLHYFLLNKGPWDRLDRNRPFVPGAPAKPEEANFYPAGATKSEVEAWMKGLPAAERAAAAGFFTAIRRATGKVGFVIVQA